MHVLQSSLFHQHHSTICQLPLLLVPTMLLLLLLFLQTPLPT
jgi:hypothetical protein